MASPAPVWEDPQCAFSVEWVPQKLDQIRIAVTDALYAVPRGGLEIGGVLLGNFNGKLLRIEDWVPMECEHLTGPSFVFSAKDEEALKTQMAKMSRQVVGWFHSHTRSEILFSPRDLQLHDTFFPQPWHIGMVLRPANMKPLRANYFFRDASGVIVPGGTEFAVEVWRGGPEPKPEDRPEEKAVVKAMPAPAPIASKPAPVEPVFLRPPAPPSQPIARPVLPDDPRPTLFEAPRPMVPEPVRLPAFMAPPVKRKPNFLLLAGLLALFGLAAAAYLTQDRWYPRPPEPLKLQASDVDGKLLIRWIPVRDAQVGKLHIADGTKQTDIDLDAMQLGQGFYLYAREAVSETVRMKVGAREETTSFAGPLTIPSAKVFGQKTDLPGSPKR